MPSKLRKRQNELPVLHPDAAVVDIGADEIFVAVPADRDTLPVHRFPTFTRDLLEAVAWLKQCSIRTVAMESTSVYWIPLYQLLETEGFEVFLVNAQYVKHVPGRKTDVSDCQWIQYLHSVGLLRGSFRPEGTICAVRSLWRHRESLIQMAARASHAYTEITRSDEPATSSCAFGQIARDYLATVEPGWGAHTIRTSKGLIEYVLIGGKLGTRPVVELNEIELQQFLKDHVASGASRSKLSKLLLYLRNILDHAVMKKIIATNAARNPGYRLKAKIAQDRLSEISQHGRVPALSGSRRR